MNLKLLFGFVFFSVNCFSQNYSSQAIQFLCQELEETSALVYFNNEFYTIAEGGNENSIFIIDNTTGCTARKIVVKNTINNDWEALTIGDDFLYIGDFGNNSVPENNKAAVFGKLVAQTAGITNMESAKYKILSQIDFTIIQTESILKSYKIFNIYGELLKEENSLSSDCREITVEKTGTSLKFIIFEMWDDSILNVKILGN